MRTRVLTTPVLSPIGSNEGNETVTVCRIPVTVGHNRYPVQGYTADLSPFNHLEPIDPWDEALMGTCPNGFFSLKLSSSCLLKTVIFLIDNRDLVVLKVVVFRNYTCLIYP